MAVTIALSQPIKHGQDELSELVLRDPTVEDIVDIGYPFLILPSDGGLGYELRPKIVMKYASRLGGVPPSVVNKISLADLSALQGAVMGFFGNEAATPRT